jgi:O-antigen/teichoic acid export membrane protein
MGALGNLLAESGFAKHTVTARSLSLGEAGDLNLQSARLSAGVAVAAAALSSCFVGSTQERVIRAILAFCIVLLTGIAAVPIAWAQRTGKLSRLEWWAVASQGLATFCIAIPAAYLGYRVFAVSLNLVIPVLFALAVSWKIADLNSQPAVRIRIERSYRLGSLGSNFGSYLAANVDTLLLATYLPTAALGVYTRANLLASLPGTIVSAAIARVGMISLSKSQLWSDHRRFLWKASILTLIAFSSLALVAGLGFDVTGFAFGRKFSTLPLGFAALTLSQIFFYGGSLLDTYLTVRRKLAIVGISHSIQAAFSGAGFLILRPTQLLPISMILLIPSGVRYLALLFAINHQRSEVVTELVAGAE